MLWVKLGSAGPWILEGDPTSPAVSLLENGSSAFPQPPGLRNESHTEPSAVSGLLPASQLEGRAHLLAEVVQLEQCLQVCALPLGSHVEVGQLSLEGPLRGGKGCQLWELCPSCLTDPSSCSFHLRRLLGQLQASPVLGLSGERRGICSAPALAEACPRVRNLPLACC